MITVDPKIIATVVGAYGYPYEFSQDRVETHQAEELRVSCKHGNRTYYVTSKIEDEALARTDPNKVISNEFVRLAEKLTVSLGEGITGKYPFTRLWSDNHLSTVSKLFMHPSKDVPGWVHNKFRGQYMYPKEGEISLVTMRTQIATVDVDEQGNDPHTTEALRKKAQMSRITAPTGTITADQILKEVKNVGKRTVKVVKGRQINPEQVKKPLCKDHNTKMNFDAVRQVWKCPVEDCAVIARPKGDDSVVKIGKGNIQCRLISQDGAQTVVLISDDNLCLDITKFVDVEKLLDEFDAVTIADTASENGCETLSINDPKQLPLKMSLTIMGATDLVMSKGK